MIGAQPSKLLQKFRMRHRGISRTLLFLERACDHPLQLPNFEESFTPACNIRRQTNILSCNIRRQTNKTSSAIFVDKRISYAHCDLRRQTNKISCAIFVDKRISHAQRNIRRQTNTACNTRRQTNILSLLTRLRTPETKTTKKEVEISTNASDALLNCARKSDLVFEISEKT